MECAAVWSLVPPENIQPHSREQKRKSVMTKQLEQPRRAFANWFRSMWWIFIKSAWLMLLPKRRSENHEIFRKLYFHRWLYSSTSRKKSLAGWIMPKSAEFCGKKSPSALCLPCALNHMLRWQRSSYANWNLLVFFIRNCRWWIIKFFIVVSRAVIPPRFQHHRMASVFISLRTHADLFPKYQTLHKLRANW